MTELFFADVGSDYAGLIQGLRARVEQLNISRVCLDAVAGFTPGYSGRILAPYAKKKIGQMSLGLILKAAGLKMIIANDPEAKKTHSEMELDHLLKATGLKVLLVDDRQQLAKMETMYQPRAAEQARPNNTARKSKGRRKPRVKSARIKKPAQPPRAKPYLSLAAS